MTKKNLSIVMAILIVGGSFVAASSLKAPVPSDINIVPPAPSLPDEVKALLGKWQGSWNSRWGWDCVIYVERVNIDSAQIILSWGAYSTGGSSCHCMPNWTKIKKAKVDYSDGKATLEFFTPNLHALQFRKETHVVKGTSGRYSFSFELEKSEPDLLKGHFISGKGSHLYTKMKKVD